LPESTDVDKLASLLMRDKAANPSKYAMMTISEGATMLGGEMVMGDREDSFGHKKLGGVGQVTGEVLREITGQGIIYQRLGYLMRSGSPDSLDLMVAMNYAMMAVNLAVKKVFGRLVALRNGSYTNVSIDVVRQGVKRVDVGALYDTENYRPKIHDIDGKPMFLY
jgi:6-phosphofructokinase